MARHERPSDPYATPPLKHDGSGAVVRFAIIALLLGGAAFGYMTFVEQDHQAAELAPIETTPVPQQFAEAPPLPETPAEPAATPAPTPQPTPAPRRVAPRPAPEPAAEPEPTPVAPPPATQPIPELPAPIEPIQ